MEWPICQACVAHRSLSFQFFKGQEVSCPIQASCTISEAQSLGSGALIVAHELAHNMGVDHDGEGVNKDCDGALRVLDFSINIKITLLQRNFTMPYFFGI